MKSAMFVLNNPSAPRLSPELAVEIGLNESILLLQIEFWIRTSTTEEHEGQRWTYQSVKDIQEFFKFWSLSTINRTILSLANQGLILVGNFNKARYDKTRWFAISFEALSRLKSIKVSTGHEAGSNQNDAGRNQNEPDPSQDEPTIPYTTTDKTTKKIPAKSSGNHSLVFGSKTTPKKTDPQILNLMVEVLAAVCGMELEMSRPRLRAEAKSFLESGYLPDFVESKYKHGGDFWKRCWEAKELLASGRKPTLGTIRNTLKFLKDGEKMVEVLEA